MKTSTIPEHAHNSFDSVSKSVVENVTSADACQKICQDEKWCYYFQWNLLYMLCWMKKIHAPFFVHYDVENYEMFEDPRFRSTKEFIFGPKYCNSK